MRPKTRKALVKLKIASKLVLDFLVRIYLDSGHNQIFGLRHKLCHLKMKITLLSVGYYLFKQFCNF